MCANFEAEMKILKPGMKKSAIWSSRDFCKLSENFAIAGNLIKIFASEISLTSEKSYSFSLQDKSLHSVSNLFIILFYFILYFIY